MKTFYIEQNINKRNIKNFFKQVTKKENKIIINRNLVKLNIKKKSKIVKKILEILSNEKTKQIAIERNLKNDKEFVNLLYSCNLNICNKNWLFFKLLDKIIDNLLENKLRAETEIWICVNDLNNSIEEELIKLAKEFKNISIVTKYIEKFKKIEEIIYVKYGILINISNNKRKSLAKADLILNIDFPKEIINQFVIYDEAKIVDFYGDVKIKKKRFNGKIINDYDFEIDNEDEVLKFVEENQLESFDVKDVCQGLQVVPKGKVFLK